MVMYSLLDDFCYTGRIVLGVTVLTEFYLSFSCSYNKICPVYVTLYKFARIRLYTAHMDTYGIAYIFVSVKFVAALCRKRRDAMCRSAPFWFL